MGFSLGKVGNVITRGARGFGSAIGHAAKGEWSDAARDLGRGAKGTVNAFNPSAYVTGEGTVSGLYEDFMNSNPFGESTEDINRDYRAQVTQAMENTGDVWKQNADLLSTAMTRGDGTARTINSALDAYDAANRNITEGLGANANAGQKTQQYLNPMSNYINKNVTQQVQGSAGAALQSSGTQNAIARGVADASASQWNTANQQALSDSANNQQILGAMQNQSEKVLTNDIMPQQDVMDMQRDWADEQLKTQIQMANNQAAVRAGDKGWFGDTLDVITGIGNAAGAVTGAFK